MTDKKQLMKDLKRADSQEEGFVDKGLRKIGNMQKQFSKDLLEEAIKAISSGGDPGGSMIDSIIKGTLFMAPFAITGHSLDQMAGSLSYVESMINQTIKNGPKKNFSHEEAKRSFRLTQQAVEAIYNDLSNKYPVGKYTAEILGPIGATPAKQVAIESATGYFMQPGDASWLQDLIGTGVGTVTGLAGGAAIQGLNPMKITETQVAGSTMGVTKKTMANAKKAKGGAKEGEAFVEKFLGEANKRGLMKGKTADIDYDVNKQKWINKRAWYKRLLLKIQGKGGAPNASDISARQDLAQKRLKKGVDTSIEGQTVGYDELMAREILTPKAGKGKKSVPAYEEVSTHQVKDPETGLMFGEKKIKKRVGDVVEVLPPAAEKIIRDTLDKIGHTAKKERQVRAVVKEMFEEFGSKVPPQLADFESVVRRINKELKAPAPGDIQPVAKETKEVARKVLRDFITENVSPKNKANYEKYKKDASEQFIFEEDVSGEASKNLGKVRVDPETGSRIQASDYMYGPKVAASRTVLRMLDEYLPGLPDSVHTKVNKLFAHTPVNGHASLGSKLFGHIENLSKWGARRGAKGGVMAVASLLENELTDMLSQTDRGLKSEGDIVEEPIQEDIPMQGAEGGSPFVQAAETEAFDPTANAGEIDPMEDQNLEGMGPSSPFAEQPAPEMSQHQAMVQKMQEAKRAEQELEMKEKILGTPLARNTKDFLNNQEFSIAKINAQLEPEIAMGWENMLKYNPEQLEDFMLMLNQTTPDMLSHDPYKRINGRVTDNAIKASLRKKIFDDPERSNYEKVEKLNKLNQFGLYEDPPPPSEVVTRIAQTPGETPPEQF